MKTKGHATIVQKLESCICRQKSHETVKGGGGLSYGLTKIFQISIAYNSAILNGNYTVYVLKIN